MLVENDVYVIIYSDGSAENVSRYSNDWYSILEKVNAEYLIKSEPYPKMLMKNGKIIVADALWLVGMNYVRDKHKAEQKAMTEVREKYPEPMAG